jgi:hypothetical protein
MRRPGVRIPLPPQILGFSCTRKAVHDSDTLAAHAWPQRAAAILCNCVDGGRTRLERAACERGAGANLRHANTAAEWSRFTDIFGAPSRARNAGESGAAWRVEQGAAMRIAPSQPLGFSGCSPIPAESSLRERDKPVPVLEQ